MKTKRTKDKAPRKTEGYVGNKNASKGDLAKVRRSGPWLDRELDAKVTAKLAITGEAFNQLCIRGLRWAVEQ